MILKTPTQIYWCLTDRCNLRCSFCLSESDPLGRDKELDAEKRALILDDIILSRAMKVYLTGGEPLLIPETLDYANHLLENNIFTVLTTNGILLDQQTIAQCADMGLNRIQLSIHGSHPELNDSIMGGHAYERIMIALGLIHKAGIDLHLKITMTQQNIQDVPALIEQLRRFEPSLINASEVMATGRGFLNYESLRPSIEDLSRARDQIETCNQEGLNVSFKSHSLFFDEVGRPSTCTVGDETSSVCLIMPNGNMTPCTPAHIWGLSNNVLEYGIKGAWEQLPLYGQFIQADKVQGRCRS